MSEATMDGSNCFVCGKANPLGLQLSFRLEGEICRSEFTPAADHCGFDDITHGGIIFSALDDVMANWIYLKGMRAYTAKCDIRYKGSLPTGTMVSLEGHCVKNRGRLIIMHGKMIRTDTGALVAETEASFMLDSKAVAHVVRCVTAYPRRPRINDSKFKQDPTPGYPVKDLKKRWRI